MAAPKLTACARVLVVEGYGDLLFYAELLEWLGTYDGVFVQHMGGKGNLTSAARADDLAIKLETFLSPSLLAEKRAIAVIADADASGPGTAQSLGQRLSTITGQNVVAGAWTKGPPCVGLFVVPSAQGVGEIESLVWEAWSNDPGNSAARACIDGFLGCMKAAGHEAHSADKGRVAALLAVRHDEDPRLGPGARAHVFDLGRPELAQLVAFLRAL